MRTLANLGDLDGDGRDELAFGAYEPTSPGQAAVVRIHSIEGTVREHSLADSMRRLQARARSQGSCGRALRRPDWSPLDPWPRIPA